MAIGAISTYTPMQGYFTNVVVISAMFALLMCGLILYQTGEIVNGGETNYVLATVTLYVSIYNLFVSLLQLFGLAAHFLGGCRQFLGARCVLLRRLAHLAHGGVDLADAGRLLFRRGRDFLHQVGRLADVRHHLVQQVAGAFGQLQAIVAEALVDRTRAALGLQRGS